MCFSHLFGTVSFFSIAQRPAAAAAAAHVLSFHVETKPSIYLLPYVESQRNMLQCNALAEWLMFGHYQAILHYKSRFFFLLKWRLKNISRVLVTKITRFCLRRRRRSAFRAKNAQLLQDCCRARCGWYTAFTSLLILWRLTWVPTPTWWCKLHCFQNWQKSGDWS